MRLTIIGGGVSGLSLGYALLQKKKDIDLKIFESEAQTGGKIRTERADGYLCEASVNGFLNNKPETLQLAEGLSLTPLKSNDNARKRYILINGMLKLVPDNPKAFFTSDFLSITGRIRVLGEYFMPKGKNEDESLESFALRRVGREFYEKLLDPMASGIYAGDPSKMSIRSCFGKVFELEKRYGSLIKGFISLSKQAKKSNKSAAAGPSGILHSFRDGMYSLIDTLNNSLKGNILTSKAVQAVQKKADLYKVYFNDGTIHETEILIFAIPAYVASDILRDMDQQISNLLSEIPYPPVTVVAMGMDKNKIEVDIEAFGFLIPAKENRNILGTLFDSSIFANRAPEGKILLRVFVGGARSPHLALIEDEGLIKIIMSELKDILKIGAEPDFIKIFRWHKAIPQYHIGHHERLQRLETLVSNYKGLYLTGNAFKGVSVNDCIANSFELADKIVNSLISIPR